MADTRAVEQGPFRTALLLGSATAASSTVSLSTSALPATPRTGLTALHGHG
ncbi:hypothetical protein KGD83_10700 [Nocardiopsis akebiae]|uniref:Uncharacterized protein n=1 Tax=Nocardiopsis akebiae TaxID=2831968 RepID=A0ABX8C903_9ACTN|nr:hypothetical protein [Nocardiopsis akebiae]QUX30911.1 hypothetical protein KGD83_10700 [Nocardiopsis akebiae]